MQLKKIPKSSLFKQYLSSYLLVFFIPLILFLITINTVYIQSIQEEVSTTNSNALEQISLQFDEEIFELNTVGNQINYSTQFSSHILNEEKNFANQIELLQFHDNSVRSTKGIYVYLNKSNKIISSKGTMSIEGLLNNDNNFDILEKEKFIDQVKESDENISSYTFDKYVKRDLEKKVIYYMMPLGQSKQELGSIIFVVNMDPINSSLKAIDSDNKQRTNFVLDHENELVLAQGDFEPLEESDFLEKISANLKKEKNQSKYLNYTVANNTSQLSGWNFVSLIKTRQLYQPFYKVLLIFGFGIIVITILGLLLAVYFSMKNYNPINTLLKNFTESDQTVGNEWSYIKYNIAKTQSERKLLNRLMDEQAPIIRNTTMLNLIEGTQEQNSAELSRELKESNIYFPYKLFNVLILDFEREFIETENIFDLENIVQQLTALRTDDFVLEATIPYLNNNQILVIANYKTDNKEQWNEIIKVLTNVIAKEELLNESIYRISVGDTYESIDKIQTSYIEATYALERLQSHEELPDQVIYFKNIAYQEAEVFSNQAIKYPETEMSILVQSLEKGNEQTALETLDTLFTDISDYNRSDMNTQLIVSYVFNTVLKIAISYNINNLEEKYSAINEFKDFSNIVVIEDILRDLIVEISTHVLEKLQLENIKIEKSVVNYIYQNYQSSDISLEQIASDNNVSISYASKLIKEETGESFTSIIQKLRMDKFKEMLIETNKPIKDLVTEIGYYDVSNFTRKFREENNMTPGKYRKKYKK